MPGGGPDLRVGRSLLSSKPPAQLPAALTVIARATAVLDTAPPAPPSQGTGRSAPERSEGSCSHQQDPSLRSG